MTRDEIERLISEAGSIGFYTRTVLLELLDRIEALEKKTKHMLDPCKCSSWYLGVDGRDYCDNCGELRR